MGAKEFIKVSPNVTEPRAVATGLLLPTDTFNKGPVATARGSVTTAHFSYLFLIGALAELRLGFTGEALMINFCGRGLHAVRLRDD